MAHQKPLAISLIVLLSRADEPAWQWLLDYAPRVQEVIVWHDGPLPVTRPAAPHVQYYRHDLHGDYAVHRNAALAKATQPWTLFVDGDEEITEPLWAELAALINTNQYDAIKIARRDVFLGRRLHYGETGQMWLLRAARTALGRDAWQRPVHEVWQVHTARVAHTQQALWHRPALNFANFLQKLHTYAAREPLARAVLSYPRWRIILEAMLYPPGKFAYAVIWQSGWRDGWPGLFHAGAMAYYSFITRVFLYEAQKSA